MKFAVAILGLSIAMCAATHRRCDSYPPMDLTYAETVGKHQPWLIAFDRNSDNKCLKYQYEPDRKHPETVGKSTLYGGEGKNITYTLSQITGTNYFSVEGNEFDEKITIAIVEYKEFEHKGETIRYLVSIGCDKTGEEGLYFRIYISSPEAYEKAKPVYEEFQENGPKMANSDRIYDVYSKNC